MAEITAAAAIEWVVSPVIEMVINKIGNFIENNNFEKDSIEDDMNKMKTTLPEILSTMTIVEKHRIDEHNQLLLVLQIKDAVYNAIDCMDDFDYELAKKENEKLLRKKKNKLVRRVAEACSHVIHQPIVGNSSLKKNLREVNKSLDQAKASAKTLLDQMKRKIPETKNQVLKSSIPSDDIIGRKTEGESIIQWIHEKKAGPPTIIPIVGQGGLGKTTLAQMIYNDPSLNDHFESKMWLTVSDNFDLVQLTKQMLKDLCENLSTEDASFNKLQTKLQTELASKKILLILDDVWFDKDINGKYNYEESWKQFFAPLRNSDKGSTIIVTTREELVVNTMKSLGSIRRISLDALNDDDGWLLLKSKAFGSENPDNLHDLEPIGRNIVKKLKGLPLAIRVVGSRLTGEFDIEEWERVLKDDSLDNGIMEVLHRSYEHLPAHLQRCFAYCSLFPKDHYLKRDRLVHMWIAQGFVIPKEGKVLEDIGNSYFSELIVRSFIQVIKRNNKEYHVMHDLMNDLACCVSKGECYIFKEGDTLKNLGSIRHISVATEKLAHLVNVSGLDKLRTLILLSSSRYEIVNVADEVFIKMKRIRVLDIGCYLDKLPNIEECKLLHYLCFRYPSGDIATNGFRELAPDTLSKLHLLTVLFIRKNVYSFRSFHRTAHYVLPQSICSMSRLKFIDASKSTMIELGGHVQLHKVWTGPAAFYVENKDGWELHHLGDFNNIKSSLVIGGLQNVPGKEEAVQAKLDSKEQVTELKLNWKPSVVKSNIKHNEILEALRPHPNIERLEISNYPGDRFPSWLESNGLSKLTYFGLKGYCSVFKMLPALGKLSQLKKLILSGITTVSSIGDEFYGNGVFPSLEELEIYSMEGLEEWSSPRGVRLFSNLRNVILSNCPKLFSLPEMESFYSLESVEIRCCLKLRSLPKIPVSLRFLRIDEVHPDLEEQLENKNGSEWDKVAAVSGCRCIIYRDRRRVVLQEGEKVQEVQEGE